MHLPRSYELLSKHILATPAHYPDQHSPRPPLHIGELLIMNTGVSKPQFRRSRAKLSKSYQEALLETVADTSAELQRSRNRSLLDGILSPDVPATKRKRDTEAGESLPAKKARWAQAGPRQPRAEDKKAEQVAEPLMCGIKRTTLQQPQPTALGCRPSFLRDFIDSGIPADSGSTVLEWLKSVGSGREERCRSASYLQCSGDDPVPRNFARSAPEMGDTRDADGFAVPPTPVSAGSRSYPVDADTGSVAASDVSGSGRSSGRSRLVEDHLYRDMNLAKNNIYMRSPYEELPQHVASLIDEVRKDHPNLAAFQWMGAGEAQVEQYFCTNIFPYPNITESLQRSDKQPMAKHAVPNIGSQLRVSYPIPDMLYGYSRHGAFSRHQPQLISMGTEMVANNQGLVYPFFVIEFEGDGPTGGGTMWVATNQCLGGSTSRVKIAERLNHQLTRCKSKVVQPINSAAFSIAMSGTEARLYILWKYNELDYYMKNVDSFLLQKPKDYLEFRKYVRNILDWGKDKRLNEIRDLLDSFLEESRKRTSEAAKSRPPPSDGSTTSCGKKSRSLLFCKNSSISGSDKARSCGVDRT
ncbi:hypothetical protein V8F33_001216 [Rhypophila sp. PSN 637]